MSVARSCRRCCRTRVLFEFQEFYVNILTPYIAYRKRCRVKAITYNWLRYTAPRFGSGSLPSTTSLKYPINIILTGKKRFLFRNPAKTLIIFRVYVPSIIIITTSVLFPTIRKMILFYENPLLREGGVNETVTTGYYILRETIKSN